MPVSVVSEYSHVNTSELIYDWNQMDAAKLRPAGHVLLNDETLRDGLQSPSVRDPSIAEKIQILHLMEALGINSLDLGLPGAGAARGRGLRGAGPRDRPPQDEDSRQLRRPHPRK